MASVTKRTMTSGAVRYDARFRDPSGSQRMRTFTRKGDADKFAATVEADKLRGAYIDSNAGRVTFKVYAERWLEAQTFDVSTREAVALRLRLHVYPVLGGRELRQVRPTTVQSWLRGLSALAPSYRQVIFVNVGSIFAAAVDDELLPKNPCRAASVSKPKAVPRRVVPWPVERAHAMLDALPERYQIVVTLAAGLGLRQGEVFGLSPADVDFLRGTVTVCRQVKLLGTGVQMFALPKRGRTRTVPLPESVRDDLAAYLTRFPARSVTLPYATPDGKPTTVALVLTTRESKAVNRTHFNGYVWKKSLVACGVAPTRYDGCHALRHLYASTLLEAGESIRAVSEYLGHADPGFTLRVYTHLMPESGQRSRKAVDVLLRKSEPSAIDVRSAPAVEA